MFYPKLSSPEKGCYIHHLLPATNAAMQLKQCRQGFYVFKDNETTRIQEEKRFSIKSAYDRDNRRSADEMMYGYESLVMGAVLYFDVEIDDDAVAGDIAKAISGRHHIGRSRTAQYGLVQIEPHSYDEVKSSASAGQITVYADARLIFLDANGQPTLQPTPQQLGIAGGAIAWEKCQIRTFDYAPWNSTRQCFDTNRCGIEKGSVIVVEGGKIESPQSRYIGCYNNEGFGKVIYNPWFLHANAAGNALCSINSRTISAPKAAACSAAGNDLLLMRLKARRDEAAANDNSYKIVNDFIKANGRRFITESFASQWGTIRAIAMRCTSKKEILQKLFTPKTGYLTHGKSQEKWEQYGRSQKLKEFAESLSDAYAVVAMVNLSSEMAKLCKKEGMKK